ncbi:MAG: hypothetical protein ACI92G_003325 [Candidatus Pelagisphaera sp.]|jgi:hypothetical protein
MAGAQRLLSMIVIGRNDDYMEDYLYRLSNTLCFLASNLSELDRLDQMEVVLVDWGSEVLLKDVLNLSEDAIAITKFAYVAPEIIEEASPGTNFHATLSVNTGIRRASGRYIMPADSDSLMPLYSLNSLLELLAGERTSPVSIDRAYLHIRRYQIPWQICTRKPSIKQWSRYCTILASSLHAESTAVAANCLGGFAAAQLIHRDIWEELGAYDESLNAAWGWNDNELMIRLSGKYPSIDLSLFGVYSMHVEHLPVRVKSLNSGCRQMNPMKINYGMMVNGETWGLGGRGDIVLEKAVPDKNAARSVDFEKDFLPLSAVFDSDKDFEEPFSRESLGRFSGALLDPAMRSSRWELSILLAYFSEKANPVNFYWLGSLEIDCLIPTLAFSRGMDCYLMNIWDEGIEDVAGINGPSNLSLELGLIDYKGHARIMLGDVLASIETLREDPIALSMVELAFLSEELGESTFAAALKKVYGLLVKGGLIVISRSGNGRAPSTERLFPEWVEARSGISPKIGRFSTSGIDFVDASIKALLESEEGATAFSLDVGNAVLITRRYGN